jgi:hypothetical protein
MKSEPKWGRNDILQLNWIFDEFFATPSVWKKVFEPFKIKCRPVTNRKGVELNSVAQLVTQENVDVKTDRLDPETCGICRRVKYLWPRRDKFPALTAEPSEHLVKTKQYFGSGAAADNGILISKQLALALREANVRGASVKPVACSGEKKRSKRCAVETKLR